MGTTFRGAAAGVRRAFRGAACAIILCAAPSVHAALPFTDNFSDGDMAGWTVVDQGVSGGPSNWYVVEGGLIQTRAVHTDVSPLYPGTFAWTGDSSWTDYYVKARLRPATGGAIGVMFRYGDPDNYYRFSMSHDGSYRRLVRVAGGSAAVLAQDSSPPTPGNDSLVEIRAGGASILVILDGEEILRATDTAFSSGGIALYSHRDPGSHFAYVIAAGLENDFDGDSVPDILDADDDNDGFGDSIEILSGSDPLDAASVPARLAVDIGPAGIRRPALSLPESLGGFGVARGYGWHGLLSTVRVTGGLVRPLYVTHAPGDPGRIFIVEQRDGVTGRVRILDLGTGALLPAPFLSISPVSTGGEQGLLGLAFHPDYADNGFFYVNYTDAGGTKVIARYTVSGDPDIADAASAQTVLTIPQPYENHNGGWMGFGPDGYLYITSGDGGSGGDPHNYAQDLDSLLGKMLRIDVDGDDFPGDPGRNYRIPPDNPFADGPGLDEIWAYGLRNPWRASFDRETGDLWTGDVGQDEREEIDFQPGASAGGENYGWRCYEGSIPYDTGGCPPPAEMVFPVHDYSHAGGNCSVTGGSVYRGSAMPWLAGTYFFADFCTARIWSFRFDGANVTEFADRTADLAPGGGFAINLVSSFGEDADGELYICDLGGEVFRIVPRPR
ncbi:MAG: PQQ-dependent sugar dehydrogenase [bacterium]|nr:PQQ-dependent sugar dehydrogenase [bacterium]